MVLDGATQSAGLNREYCIFKGYLFVDRGIAELLEVPEIAEDQSVGVHHFGVELGILEVGSELP